MIVLPYFIAAKYNIKLIAPTKRSVKNITMHTARKVDKGIGESFSLLGIGVGEWDGISTTLGEININLLLWWTKILNNDNWKFKKFQ